MHWLNVWLALPSLWWGQCDIQQVCTRSMSLIYHCSYMLLFIAGSFPWPGWSAAATLQALPAVTTRIFWLLFTGESARGAQGPGMGDTTQRYHVSTTPYTANNYTWICVLVLNIWKCKILLVADFIFGCNRFLPFKTKTYSYEKLLHSTSQFGHLNYGTKHFRPENREQFITDKVSIEICIWLCRTYVRALVVLVSYCMIHFDID